MIIFRNILVCLGFGAALVACNTTNVFERALVDPGQYAIYTCKELYTAIEGEEKRQNTLRNLMAKAASGAGGDFVSAAVYRPEYLQSRGNQLAAQETLKDKRCGPPEVERLR